MNKKTLLVILSLFLALLACDSDNHALIYPPTPEVEAEVYPEPAEATNIVVAHRGGSTEGKVPDNSLASLNYAIGLNCFASECDIYVTKDNKVIVAHADGSDKINGLHPWAATYDEIKAAGKLSNGEDIPTLDTYLDRVLEAGTIRLWIDVKSISAVDATKGNEYSSLAAEKAADIIREKKAKNFVTFIVGRDPVYKRALAASKGGWMCGHMNASFTPSDFQSKGYAWANFSTQSAFYYNGVVKGEYLIEDYKKVGVKVSVYNVDSQADRTWYAAKKDLLFGICTNYPKAMLTALGK